MKAITLLFIVLLGSCTLTKTPLTIHPAVIKANANFYEEAVKDSIYAHKRTRKVYVISETEMGEPCYRRVN